MSKKVFAALAAGFVLATPLAANASSHMDAPLITFDDAANTTDVYAFLSEGDKGQLYLTTALSVFPFEEPGIGPNTYRFDDRVRYAINVSFDDNIAQGQSNLRYEFDFSTQYSNQNTILQAFLGTVAPNGENQNLRQTYRVTKVETKGRKRGKRTVLGVGERDDLFVPPNNQGLVTPLYNRGENGDRRAKGGVKRSDRLDPYTQSGVVNLDGGYQVFAGQRDDGFYADIQSIFDLDLSFGETTGTKTKPFDSQGGFNVHTIVLNIPIEELNGAKIAGVFATTSRERFSKPGATKSFEEFTRPNAPLKQVGRQGNPLFVEALLPINKKDGYNQSSPETDLALAQFAQKPELSSLGPVEPIIPGLLESIYIPDLIKVDLTTGPARLAGQDDFNRLGVFGGDVLKSEVQDPFGNGGFIPGGWPNGRRFGDDVLDIAVIAVGLAGPAGTDFSTADVDGVSENDITFNDVFPYAATPHNGRNHPNQRRRRSSDDGASE